MDMRHVMKMVAGTKPDEHSCIFMDYFCAVVASRWRANSVLAAQPYKTKNEQEAVMLALHESSRRLCDFAFTGTQVTWCPRIHPGSLAELRGMDDLTHYNPGTGGVRPYW
jgi:hypothetical protein